MKNVSITSAGKHLRLQCPVARVEKGKVKGPVSRSDSHDILSDSLRSRTIWRSAAAEFRDELEIQGVNIPRQTSRFSLTRNDVFFSNKLSALHLRGKASDTDMFTIKMFDSCSKENEMSSHSVFKGCDDTVKARLEAYWAKKLPRLQKLLVPYRTDLQEIRLTVYHHQQNPQRSWYETRAVIHLPTGTLVAEANDKDPQAALDRVADALAAEIKRHKERVRKDYLFKRKTRQHAGLSAASPLLQRDVEIGRRQDFFQLLRPLLRFLHDHARRELRVLELEGTLHRGEVTVDDLMDEVLIRAWHQFHNRPRHLPLELWLTDLLHQALEEWVKQEPRQHVSLEEKTEEALPNEVPPMEEKQEEEEKEWWDELPPFEQTVLLEDLIPGSQGTESWDELEVEEQRDRLLSLLGELPAAQRQTFLLHTLEDYDTAEIAMLQDRPESQVKADIEAALQTLRDRLLARGYMQEAGKLATASQTATQTREP